MRSRQYWKVRLMSGVEEELEEGGTMSLMSFYYFLYTILGNSEQEMEEKP